jgi:3-oxoacyl-[acyl-carrier protein] reductase
MSKNVLITGASRGLGRAIAHAFWQNGASLIITARSEDDLKSLQNELRSSAKLTQQVDFIVADLSSATAITDLIAQARRVWDYIDVLVNNAAVVGPIGTAWEDNWESWIFTLNVNLFAPVQLCRLCIPWMKECGKGKIINISGGGATGPRPRFSPYATAKVGLVRFTETLAMELKEFNIQVNAVAPGMMNSEMTAAVLAAGKERAGEKEYADAAAQGIAMKDNAEKAARLCVYLASSFGDSITGKLISAVWDSWENLADHSEELATSDIYTLRRIVPRDRGKSWS